MRTIGMLFACTALAAGGLALAQDVRPQINRADLPGRLPFERWCAPCHGAGSGDDGDAYLPGTARLRTRDAGARPGELELRDDLPAPVLALFVRRGVGGMPGFRKTEVSDADIAAIADYLSATARASR